jgi:nucleoside-diphosphate-sugar epimerase
VVNTLTVRAFAKANLASLAAISSVHSLHVPGLGRAVVDNLETPHTGIFNLHRQNVRIIDLAYQVRNHFPDVTIEQTPMKFQDVRNYRVSSKKAQEILGFRAVHAIDEGIEEIKELLCSCRLRDVDNPRYTNQVYLSMFNTHETIEKR